MALTPLATVEDPLPSPSNIDTFNDDMDRFINTKLPLLAEEVDAVAVAFTLNATNSTSTTSVAIGTGTKNYTVQTGKSYLKGMYVIAADDAAPSTNYNYGQVLSYDSGTGALSIDVITAAGSGTKTAWSISQTSVGGAPTTGYTSTGDIIVPDEAYNATNWNGNLEVPTKNAVRDKIEAMSLRPAFGVDKASNQGLTSGVLALAVWPTELFDTNSNFASNRFTPTVAGYYQINASLRCQATNMTASTISVYKNGSVYCNGSSAAGITTSTPITQTVSTVVYCNGSTDYIEIYGSVTGTNPIFQYGAAGGNGFSGCLLAHA